MSSQADAIEAALRKAGLKVSAIRPGERVERISTGSLAMDRALGGGWAKGMINGIAGLDSYGKTTLCAQAAAWFLAHDDRPVAYFDAETRLDPEWAERNGMDLSRVAIFRGFDDDKNRLGQETVLKMVSMTVTKELAGLVIIDSLASMVPQQVGVGDKGDPEYGKVVMGVRARNFDDFFGVIAPFLFSSNITMLVTNQLRDSMDPRGDPFVEPGGRRKNHSFTINVRLLKPSTTVDTDGNTVQLILRGKTRKNSTFQPGKEFEVYLGIHPSGHVFPDIVPELCEIGKDLGVFTNANGDRFSTGIWHYKGMPLMLNGNKVSSIALARELLATDADLRSEIESVIREKIGGYYAP